MENKTVYNYYVHLVRFISEEEEREKRKNIRLRGNVEMIVVLIHMVRKNVNVFEDSLH